MARTTLQALAAEAHGRALTLDLPQQAFERGGVALGQVVAVQPRPYGLEFARSDTRQAFSCSTTTGTATSARMRWRSERRPRRDLLAIVAGLAAAAGCHAGGLRFCDDPPALNATQQDRLLRFAVVKDELERSDRSVVLVARSGVDLSRFGVRYSHAGISLKANRLTPWSGAAGRRSRRAASRGRTTA